MIEAGRKAIALLKPSPNSNECHSFNFILAIIDGKPQHFLAVLKKHQDWFGAPPTLPYRDRSINLGDIPPCNARKDIGDVVGVVKKCFTTIWYRKLFKTMK